MRNKILLIYPKFHKVDFDAKSFPLGLLSMGTILKQKGYEVELIDFLVESNPMELLKNELDDNVLSVGISVMTPQILNAIEISEYVKKYNKNIAVVWGGIHPTLFPDQTIINPFIDYLIIGEGEISFLKLLKYFNGQEDINNIGGLIYKKDGQIIKNFEKDLIDLNDLPILDYSLLSPKTLKFDLMILNTSRGCPYRCTFCVNISLHNRAWRFQRSGKILPELEFIINNL
ncbi:MAG: cobalamin-dependent protein, partial [Patescibacteria group bacterium]